MLPKEILQLVPQLGVLDADRGDVPLAIGRREFDAVLKVIRQAPVPILRNSRIHGRTHKGIEPNNPTPVPLSPNLYSGRR